MKETIHDYDKRLERYRRLVNNSSEITPRSKELIFKFIEACAREGLSKARLVKYYEHMKSIAEKLNKDLDSVKKKDIEKFVGDLELSDYADGTKQNYKVALKRFYRWMHGLPRGKYPELVEWINTTLKNHNSKLPEDLLTEDDVSKLVEATPHTRDKALIALLWDAGLRVGEAGTLRIKNVQFDDYGAVIIVHGKTGQRRVRILWSVPFLMNWIEEHPLKDDQEAPLWVNLWNKKYDAMNYYGIRKQLATSVKKAGIKKRIYPHIFRHSRATFMANHLTEAQMKEYFGWTQSSDMAAIYVHLSGRDVDDAILKIHGVKKPEEDEKPKNKKCPRCSRINMPSSTFCSNCGAVLDIKTAMKLQEVKETLMEEVSVQERLLAKLEAFKSLQAEMQALRKEVEALRAKS